MLIKLIREDIKQGIWARKAIYVIVLIAVSIMTVLYCKSFIGKGVTHISFGDMIVYHFRGMKEYIKNPLDKDGFEVPENLLIWVLLTAFLIGHYPVKDLKGVGRNYLIQSGRRLYWWIGKCIFSVCSVITLIAMIMLGTLVGILVSGKLYGNTVVGLVVNPTLIRKTFRVKDIPSDSSLTVKTMILVTLSLMALSLMQLMFIVIGNAITGYISVVAVAILSAYYMRFYMPGNGVMVYRYVEINDKGIGLSNTVCSLIIMMVISVIVGYISFRRKDII